MIKQPGQARLCFITITALNSGDSYRRTLKSKRESQKTIFLRTHPEKNAGAVAVECFAFLVPTGKGCLVQGKNRGLTIIKLYIITFVFPLHQAPFTGRYQTECPRSENNTKALLRLTGKEECLMGFRNGPLHLKIRVTVTLVASRPLS